MRWHLRNEKAAAVGGYKGLGSRRELTACARTGDRKRPEGLELSGRGGL